MKKLSAERKVYIDEMLESSSDIVSLDDVVVESSKHNRFGSLITADGKIYALRKYGIHGVVAAILYPKEASEFGLPQPTGDLESIPKMSYQEFDLSYGKHLPLIRISCGLGLTISHGFDDCWPNDVQIETLRHYLHDNDLLASETVTEYTVASARKVLQGLRNRQFNE